MAKLPVEVYMLGYSRKYPVAGPGGVLVIKFFGICMTNQGKKTDSKKRKKCFKITQWAFEDLNLGPIDYESTALTN